MPYPIFRSVLSATIISCLFISCSPAEEPVSKEEAVKMAHSIELSVARHNPALINSILDVRAFAARIEKNTQMDVSSAMREIISQSLQKRMLGKEIVDAVGSAGSYQLLRRYEKEGKQHLLFRMYGDGGINYHDYELVKRERQVKAADLFLYYSGEPLSTTFGNVVMDMTGKLNKEAQPHIEDIKKIQGLLAAKDYEGAKAEYDALPQNLKHQKTFMMTNVRICSGLEDQDAYLHSIEEYQQRYPNETNIPLLMIDLSFLRKDYPRALKAINDLDRLTGTDPFLNYYRGLAYKQAGDHANYVRCIERLYAYAPTFADGSIELISAYLDDDDFDKARPVIQAFRKHKSWNQALLNNIIQQKQNAPADLMNTPA